MGVSEKSIDIVDLIPQRAPMVLVDRFLGIDSEGVSHTTLSVVGDCLFVERGALTECGIIEHMAQSAAARVGWQCQTQGQEVPIGFIGAVAKLTVHSLPRLGCEVRTSLSVVQQVGPISLVELSCEVEGKVVATGDLKIFLQQ